MSDTKDTEEFDESAADTQADKIGAHNAGYFQNAPKSCFIEGARWQHAKDQRLIAELRHEREKSQTLIALLQSLGVQAIVNGQDGHRLVAERINSAIEEYRGGK